MDVQCREQKRRGRSSPRGPSVAEYDFLFRAADVAGGVEYASSIGSDVTASGPNRFRRARARVGNKGRPFRAIEFLFSDGGY